MTFKLSNTARMAIYGALSGLLLFFGFFANYWRVANQQWFLSQSSDMESFIVGRLVESRQDGIVASGGLTGIGSPDATPAEFREQTLAFQTQAYVNGLAFGSFYPYESQIGGQGMLFSIMDKLLGLSSISPQARLQTFHIFTAMLSALTVCMIVLWFYQEFGLMVSLFVLASAALSPWLVVFGGKLWWSMWSFYLPMVAVMYYLKRTNRASRPVILGVLIFIAVLVKCVFTGYEYITTTLVMMVVPIVYLGIKYSLSLRKLISKSLIAVFGSSLAILLSFTILIIQIASVDGSLLKGVDRIVFSLEKRTYADPSSFEQMYAASLDSNAYAEPSGVEHSYIVSLEASTFAVLKTYLMGSFFGPTQYPPTSNPWVLGVLWRARYLYLILLLGIASILLCALTKRDLDRDRQQADLALVGTTWFSLLAPLSWFVIFKSHSYIHTHMNYIVWQMPFTFFGAAVCGELFQALLAKRLTVVRRVEVMWTGESEHERRRN